MDNMSDISPSSSTRRALLSRSAFTLGAAGACTLATPFLNSLRGVQTPSETAEKQDSVLEIDISDLKEGAGKVIAWQDYPVFIYHRTPEMMQALEKPELLALLEDPYSKIRQQPKDAANIQRAINPHYTILILICTHLGCIPNTQPTMKDHQEGTLLCPCHGSQFDGAGRVFKNMPAPYNLPIPPMTFLSDTKIRIGESKQDPLFKLSDLQQL